MGILNIMADCISRRFVAPIVFTFFVQSNCFGFPQVASDARSVTMINHSDAQASHDPRNPTVVSAFPVVPDAGVVTEQAAIPVVIESRDWPLELVQPVLPSKTNSQCLAQPHRNTGFLDFNFYPYTAVDSDNAITVNALANLDHGFQYFSLTNFARNPTRAALQEVDGILTEQNLRWQPDWQFPIAFAGQALLRTGAGDNDVFRFGPRWAVHQTGCFKQVSTRFHFKYWVACYGAQFDHTAGNQWQIEHVFRWDILPEILDNRVYISGFADHNIDHAAGTKSTWIEETQLGVRVFGQWHVVAEQRYNGFRRGNESSLGIGVQYVMRFN